MNPDILDKIAVQVPNLIVLALIVRLFLNHLNSINGLIREINQDNLRAREQSRVVIQENTSAVAKNTEVLHAINEVVNNLRKPLHDRPTRPAA